MATAPFVDGVLRDVRYAVRSFRRAPLAVATIVVTVALGLGLVAAVYTLLNTFAFRVDEVRNPHELFAVQRVRSAIVEPQTFTREDYDALLRETDAFVDAFASTSDVTALIEGARREGRLVTGNFFRMLGAGAAFGRAFAPSDDEPGAPPVLVLSHRAWLQHYDSDPGVVGRTYRVNDTPFEIIGVMPDGFRGLEVFAPDFWVPLAQVRTFEELLIGEDVFRGVGGLGIVGRLRPGIASGQAQAQLIAWDAQREAERMGDRPVASLELQPRTGTVPRLGEALVTFTPLFFAFGLILLIGCANVANLLLARLVARQREIGVRLSMGASRARVVWQLLTESLLLALASAALALVISRLVLNGIVYFIITSFPPDMGNLRIAVPDADWRVVLFLVAGAFVATVLFALAPALKGTRVELARAMQGQVLADARPGRARSALIAVQVTASALLLICAALFLRGAWSAAAVDPGVRVADVVSVSVLNEQRRAAILERLGEEPAVTAVAAAWPGFLGGLSGAPAYGEGSSGRQIVRYQLVSPEFFGVLGIDITRGRGFSAAERNPNEAVAVVSETTARELWPGAEAIGQVLRLTPDFTIGQAPQAAERAAQQRSDDPLTRERTAVVIGVARDVAGFRVGGMRLGGAGVYMPIDTDAAGTALTLRTRGDADVARRAIIDRFATLDPNMAQVATMATFARVDSYILGTSFWLTVVLGALALLLTLSGLFSVLSYLVEQRTREIGVRIALGASKRSIGALVLKQSAWPVGVGLAVGCTLTIGVSAALLATPAAEQISSIVWLFDPVAYGASIACIVAACAAAALIPALRAGSVKPLEALRQE